MWLYILDKRYTYTYQWIYPEQLGDLDIRMFQGSVDKLVWSLSGYLYIGVNGDSGTAPLPAKN